MIDLYYWPTPNGHKISIMLEECGLEYEVHPVDIGRGDQFDPGFLKISPNNKMPAIVDRETGISVFESGAILMYLAEKAGRLLPGSRTERYAVLQWLFWQVGGLGPMAGQLGHFRNYAKESIAYAEKRYADEYERLLAVMDVMLEERDYLGGDYSIADIAAFPWVRPWEKLGADIDSFVHVKRWYEIIAERDAVKRGLELGEDWQTGDPKSDEVQAIMFGQNAETVRKTAKQRGE